MSLALLIENKSSSFRDCLKNKCEENTFTLRMMMDSLTFKTKMKPAIILCPRDKKEKFDDG